MSKLDDPNYTWLKNGPNETAAFNLEFQDTHGRWIPKGAFATPSAAMAEAERLGVGGQRWRFWPAPREVWRNWK